jgi:hypothetical protein
MKLKIDREADALYLTLDDSGVVESGEVSPGTIVDYNAENEVKAFGRYLSPLGKWKPRDSSLLQCESPLVTRNGKDLF